MRQINFPDNNIKHFNLNPDKLKRTNSTLQNATAFGRTFHQIESGGVDGRFDVDFDSMLDDVRGPRLTADEHIHEFKSKLRANRSWIDDRRIKSGFEAGYVDLVNGVIHKNGEHWFHDQKRLDCKTPEELVAYISGVTQVVPFISSKDMEDMERNGEVSISGKLVAKKSDDGNWILSDSGRAMYGGVERVLHHQDMAVLLPSTDNDIDMFHGLTSSDETYKHTGWKSLSSSKQGEGCYATLSKKEAICVYANPKSMESGSKKYANPHIAELQVARDYGFLLSVKPNKDSHIFHAAIDDLISSKDCSNMPSPYLIEKLVERYKTDSNADYIDRASERATLSIINSVSTFDVYMALNTLQDDVQQHVGKDSSLKVSIIKDSLAAMGYDSILIVEPSERLLQLKGSIESELSKPLSELSCSLEDNGINPAGVSKSIDEYFNVVSKNLPPKLEGGHFIAYDENLYPDVVKATPLPMHTAILTGEFPDPRTGYSDTFYDLQNEKLDRFSDFSIKMEIVAQKNEQKKVENLSIDVSPKMKI